MNDKDTLSGPSHEDGPQVHVEAWDDAGGVDRSWATWGRSAGPLAGRARFDIEALIAHQPEILLWIEGFGAILAIAAIDQFTDSRLSLSTFYLIPVIFVSWFISRRAGMLASVVSVAVWAVPGLLVLGDAPLGVWIWNSLVRLAFFIVVVQLVHMMTVTKLREAALARTDSLTGVANGRSFSDRAEFELASLRRGRHPLTMAYIDLDRFKHINDTLGHTEGDRLLRATAHAIQSRLRATDLVARLGGDEFGVLLPDTGFAEAPAVLEALSEAVSQVVDGSWDVGCTIGAVTFEMAPESVDFMVRSADELMYRGKRAGRGRIEHAAWPGARLERSAGGTSTSC